MTDKTRVKLAALLRCAARCVDHGLDSGIEYRQTIMRRSGPTDEIITINVEKLELPRTEEKPDA